MLSFLRIRHLAIVKDLSLEWGPGLNLLTGETGAGKSVLVEALGLVLGDRASSDMVRSGAEKAEIEAVFEVGRHDSPARALLASLGLPSDEDEIIIRREIGDGSRSRQFLCDAPVSLATLRKLGDLMVEIQGQHQHHALLGAEAQRESLDEYAGLVADRERLRQLARAANHAAGSLAGMEERVAGRSARLEDLQLQRQELETLAPSAGDEEALRAERARLQHATRRRELAEGVYRAMYEEDPSLLGQMARVVSDLRRLAEIDPAAEGFADGFEQALRLLEDAVLEVRDYRKGAEPDPGRLEEVEERLAAYERLARRHGIRTADLATRLTDVKAETAALESAAESLTAAKRESERLRGQYLAAARVLSSKRKKAAIGLAEALRKELGTLAMAGSRIEIAVATEEPAGAALLKEAGLDEIELRLSANPGEPVRPLSDIVSGGELSRVMLAVNSALVAGSALLAGLAPRDAAGALEAARPRRTLVFDEVDAGIGGRTAAVVGEKLRDLAAAHQVIVVTHLPQIASLAERHFVVEKRVEAGRTVALVHQLDAEGRVMEIARMMGDKEASPIARRHAADLLRRSAPRPERRVP